MLKMKNYKFWFCTGSQDLYGDECLANVAKHSQIIVEELNKSGVLPFEVVWKPTLITNELIRKTANDLTDAIARAQTKEELEELYQKFNLNNTKKNALRITQLNDLLDQVNKQASDRFTRRPDEISNKEILDYMTAIQNQIERSQRTVDGIRDLTAVQFNSTQNNTVNILI